MREKTILIIDDDPHLLLGLTPRIKASGYKVTASSAASAMAMARVELPDLIIPDLKLPALSDGLLLLRKIRVQRSL
jgi:DNA-binding response OmpR family regulator